MVDVSREFAARPPREPLTTLGALVRDFIWRYPRDRRDMVVEYCRWSPSLVKAITRAVMSKDANGKHHNHQSKIKRSDYKPMAMELQRARRRIAGTSDFDSLHDLIAELRVPGWGPVGVYDVATRIGAYLDLEPTSVYLHAGVKLGAAAWFGDDFVRGRQRIEVDELPLPLRSLTADEVEDFLCTYRTCFEGIHQGVDVGGVV